MWTYQLANKRKLVKDDVQLEVSRKCLVPRAFRHLKGSKTQEVGHVRSIRVRNTASRRTYYTYITSSHLGVGRGEGCACSTAPPLYQISPSSGTATTCTWCVLVHDLPTESSVWHQPRGRVLIRCSTTTYSLQYTYLNDLVNLNKFSGASLQ